MCPAWLLAPGVSEASYITQPKEVGFLRVGSGNNKNGQDLLFANLSIYLSVSISIYMLVRCDKLGA